MPRNQLRRKKFDRWPKVCSWCAVAWRLKASFAFTIHFPMTKTGSTWIRCVAPAAAVDPRVVRGRSPPPGEATLADCGSASGLTDCPKRFKRERVDTA